MFNLDRAIEEWRRQMLAAGIKNPVPLDELESHLRDDVEEQIRSGVNAQQAFEAAVQRVGQAGALKAEFKKAGGMIWALRRRVKGIILRFVGWGDAIPLSSLNDFTPNARQVLELAREEPPRFHHDFIGTEHVLLGLLKSEQGVVSNVLRRFGVEREAVKTEIEKLVGVGPVHQASAAIPYTPRARKALQLAASEAKAMNHAYVGTEHIFLGLLIEGGGVAALVLKNLGLQVERTREEIVKELKPNQSNG